MCCRTDRHEISSQPEGTKSQWTGRQSSLERPGRAGHTVRSSNHIRAAHHLTMKAIVLAAGEGSRLRPLTTRRPKPMLPVVNRPILAYVIGALAEAGITEIVLVVGYKRDRIQRYVGDGDGWNVDIEYVVQEDQLGTGHAVEQVRSHVDDEFLVLNGDRIIDASLIERVRETGAGETSATISATRVDHPHEYGVVVREGSELSHIEEKPVGKPSSAVINAGVYRFTEAIFEHIEASEVSEDGERRLTSAVTRLGQSEQVDIVTYHDRWLDVTYPWDLLTVNDELVRNRPGPDTGQVHESATVTERVHLADGATVGANATVKRGASIGPNVSIGSNAVVSNAVIMADATIGDGAVIRDCIVDENVTIGPNTTVGGGRAAVPIGDTIHRNVTLGGVLGANADVGSGVVISPGTVLGDGVTVGGGSVLEGRIESNTRIQRG